MTARKAAVDVKTFSYFTYGFCTPSRSERRTGMRAGYIDRRLVNNVLSRLLTLQGVRSEPWVKVR